MILKGQSQNLWEFNQLAPAITEKPALVGPTMSIRWISGGERKLKRGKSHSSHTGGHFAKKI
jgi:hypothetical protein